MSRQHYSRVDRFAQMSKQEEVIAKKRQEILEKQRTVELAKQVAAAQSIASKQKTNADSSNSEEVDSSEPPPVTGPGQSKLKNTFCNDGSFLAHFKKILEKHKPEPPQAQAEAQAEPETEEQVNAQTELEPVQLPLPTQVQEQQLHQQQQQPSSQQVPITVPMTLTELPQSSITSNSYFNPSIPPPIMNLQVTVPPPPPPPPPVSIAQCIPPLYMIPPPEPLQLNTIPPPKELDLNAIPKPELNLDAIQVPTEMDKVFSDNSNDSITLPTSLETLIDLVADFGDGYEDKIRSHKNAIHPTLW